MLPRIISRNPWADLSFLGFALISFLIGTLALMQPISFLHYFGIIFFLGGAVLFIIFLFSSAFVPIKFHSKGITFDEFMQFGGVRTLRWEDLESVELRQMKSGETILRVIVKNPENYINRNSRIGKATATLQEQRIKEFGTPFVIEQAQVDIKLVELKTVFLDYLAAYHRKNDHDRFIDDRERMFLVGLVALIVTVFSLVQIIWPQYSFLFFVYAGVVVLLNFVSIAVRLAGLNLPRLSRYAHPHIRIALNVVSAIALSAMISGVAMLFILILKMS